MGKRIVEDVSAYSSHFSDALSREAQAYMQDVAFDNRYIFIESTRRKHRGSVQTCYCTHCGTTFEASGYRHGMTQTCQFCSSKCIVKAAGIGRSRMVDEAYFVWYEHSLINPETITARGVFCVRDYRGDYRQTTTQWMTVGMYVFRPGKAVMFKRSFWYSWGKYYPQGFQYGEFKQTASMHPVCRIQTGPLYTSAGNRVLCCSYKSIRNAVKNTPFQYSCWNELSFEGDDDYTRFFGLYCTAPCIEYLIKMGMENLVIGKICGHNTYRTVNWRGKSVTSVLRLDKQHIKALKDSEVVVDFSFLRIYQKLLRLGEKFAPKDASLIAHRFNHWYDGNKDGFDGLVEMAERMKMSVKATVAYIEKQMGTRDKRHSYTNEVDMLRTWRDYLRDCDTLGMNMDSESTKMPRNLYTAHQNTVKQIQIKKNEKLDGKIAEQAEKLAGFKFTYGGLLAVPAHSSLELIEEGMALNHCVGTYAERVAEGRTAILFIRRADAPETPYYTMEVSNGSIFQVRGRDNHNATPDVKDFVEAFKAKKLNKTKKQKRPRQQYAAAMA